MAKAKKTTSAKATAVKTAKKPVAKKTNSKKPAAPKASAKNAGGKKTAGAKATAKKAATQNSSVKKSASSAPTKMASKASGKSNSTSTGKAASASDIKWDQFLTPLDDRVIVEIKSGEKMTAGGLYIPDTVTDTSGNYKGYVLAAGRGHRDEKGKVHPMDVQAGDTVLFSEFTGAKMEIMGHEVRILRESEILGIVTKK